MKELLKPDGSTTGVFVIEVPEDAYDFEVFNTYRKEIRYLHKGSENPLTGGEKHSAIPIGKFTTLEPISILGTATSESIDFDVSGIVDGNNGGVDDTMWQDYTMGDCFAPFQFSDKEQSFCSLLAYNGLYWVNELPVPLKKDYGLDAPQFNSKDPLPQELYKHDLEKWQALEDKKLTGKLLFIKSKN